VLGGSTIRSAHDVNRLLVDLLAAAASSSPSDPGYGSVAGPEEILYGNLLLLVGRVVDPDDVGEPVDTGDRTLA
jgi:hypothetical protein